MPDPTTALTAGSLVIGGYISSEGAKDAARTSSSAAERAADLEYRQYLQSRQDLAPYREVATGREIYGNKNKFNEDTAKWNRDLSAAKREAVANGRAGDVYQIEQDFQQTKPKESDYGDFNEVTGYTGGALNTLADYGQSKVNAGDYIPPSQIPELGNRLNNLPEISDLNLQGSGSLNNRTPLYNDNSKVSQFSYTGEKPVYKDNSNIPEFNVKGDIPKFDSTQFDIYKDPSYEWRFDEAMRVVNRENAPGKLNSGNRLAALQDRASNLASTEYAAARDRMVQDYGINRENEATQYGRDVSAYDIGRQNEATAYGRGVTTYDIQRLSEADDYARATGQYGLSREVEQELYNRGLTRYDIEKIKSDTQFNRSLIGTNLNNRNALAKYGYDTDTYNRSYGKTTDIFNADTSRENSLYGRGVSNFNIAAGQEADYLNRLGILSGYGQNAVNNTVNAGSNYATNAGNSIVSSGNNRAAGIVGSTGAWNNVMNQLAYGYGMYSGQRQPYNTYNYDGYGGGIPYDQFIADSNYIPYR